MEDALVEELVLLPRLDHVHPDTEEIVSRASNEGSDDFVCIPISRFPWINVRFA